MQNILFLLLFSKLLFMVKGFSLDYRYSNQQKYSTFFLSNMNSREVSYYSNYFNSKQVSYNCYSNYFNSNTLQSIVSYKYSKSQDSFNGYLSIIKTMPSQSMSSYKYNSFNSYLSIIKTMPLKSMSLLYYSSSPPTLVPTIAPITTATLIPTLIPSINKKQIEVPTMSFDTKLTFDNYDNEELDIKSQEAIIIATANSMNISASYIEYIGSTIARRRLIIFRILGYNLIVTLKTTIPLQEKTDPSLLYDTITANLINSVNSGLFTSYLLTASNTLGITSFANSSITSVENDAYVIKQPDKPYIKDNETPKIYTTIYIIFSVLLFVYLIMYFVWLRRKYINKNRQMRSLFSNMTNPTDITIHIVEE